MSTTAHAPHRPPDAGAPLAPAVLATTVHPVVWAALPADLGADESSDVELFYEPGRASRWWTATASWLPTAGPPCATHRVSRVLLAGPVAGGRRHRGVPLARCSAVLTAMPWGSRAVCSTWWGGACSARCAALLGALLWTFWPLNL